MPLLLGTVILTRFTYFLFKKCLPIVLLFIHAFLNLSNVFHSTLHVHVFPLHHSLIMHVYVTQYFAVQSFMPFFLHCVSFSSSFMFVFLCLTQMLLRMLESLGLASKPQMVSRFEEVYKQMWTLNGDHVSRNYAGTGAMGGGRSKVRTDC